MARYLLIANTVSPDDTFDTAILLPTEGFNGKAIEVEVRKGILQNFPSGDLTNKKLIHSLLIRLAKCNIVRNKDGLITHGSKVYDIDFKDFICDICQKKFSKHYEPIYCLLRNNGIVF